MNPHGQRGDVAPETVDAAMERWQNNRTRANRLALIGLLQAVEDDRAEVSTP